MKKTFWALAALSIPTIISCQKENGTDSNIPEVITETINAEIEQDIFVKSDYTDQGVFSWSEGDKFGRLGRNSEYVTSTYTAEYGIGGQTSGNFTGTAPAGATSYAIYPVEASNGASITADNSSALYLNRPATIEYDVNNPRKNIVPMMGKLTNGEYVFYPISGMIGFHAENISAEATSITLSSSPNSKGLSGKSVLLTSNSNADAGISGLEMIDGHRYGWKRGWMNGDGTTISLTFQPGSFTEADFYFPVPPTYTGSGDSKTSLPYDGLTITLKNASGDIIGRASTSRSIAVDRAEIVWLPAIAFIPVSVSVSCIGTSRDIKAYIQSESCIGSFDKVCVAALSGNTDNDLNTAIPDNNAGIDVTSATSAQTAISVSGFSTSGLNYLGVKAFSGTSQVFSSIIPVYYLSSSDESNIISQYCYNVGARSTPNPSNYEASLLLKGANYLSLAVSDDPMKGNVMITDLFGINYQLIDCIMPTTSYTPGTALYGTYSQENNRADFKVKDVPYFYFDGSNNHWISTCSSNEETLHLSFNYAVNDITYDLVCTNTFLGDAKGRWQGSSGNYLFYYSNNKYSADKTKGMIPLTVGMLDAISTLTTGAADRTGGLGALIDKSGGSTSWWVDYAAADRPKTDDQGIWIQIDLGESKTVNNFTLKFLTSNVSGNAVHGIPKEYKIAVSNDGASWEDKTDAITISSPAETTWYQQKVNAGGDYRYVRLCITKMNRTETWNQVIPLTNRQISGSGQPDTACYTTLDEIQIWEDYQ